MYIIESANDCGFMGRVSPSHKLSLLAVATISALGCLSERATIIFVLLTSCKEVELYKIIIWMSIGGSPHFSGGIHLNESGCAPVNLWFRNNF